MTIFRIIIGSILFLLLVFHFAAIIVNCIQVDNEDARRERT